MPALTATPTAVRQVTRRAVTPGGALRVRAAAVGAPSARAMPALSALCRPAAGLPTRRTPTTPTPARRPSSSSVVVAASPGGGDVPILDRAAAAAPYLIPLVDALSRGRFLFLQFPAVFSLLLAPIRPLASLYYSVPFASLVVFFAVYLGIIQNANFSRFVRYSAMQAILLDILLVFPSLLERVVGGPPRGGLALDLYMSASSTIFLFVLACFVLGAGSALVGKTARLPLVAEAADSQTRF